MEMKKLKYRDDINMFDIIEIDFSKYVVISISYEEIIVEPLNDYIMRNSLVIYDGRYQSIMELVNDKAARFVADRDKGLSADFDMESGVYKVNGW